MNYKRKRLLGMTVGILFPFIPVQPASAAGIGEFISGVQSTIDQVMNIFNGDGIQTYLEAEFGEVLPELQAVLDGTGEGQFPNPTKLEESIEAVGLEELLPSLGDLAQENESVVGRKDAAAELTSHIAIAVADESTFSDEAQQAMKERIEGSLASVETQQALAEDSAGQDVTQNIERNQSEQLAMIGEQLSLLVIDGQQGRVDRAMSSVLQAESLQEIQGQNLKERREQTSAAAHSMQAAVGVQMFGRSQP